MHEMPPQPEVIRQTAEWLVVNKPGGWHSVRLPADGSIEDRRPTPDSIPILQDWLAERFGELAMLPESGLVQRLDLLTSGCVIVGRTAQAVARLSGAVRSESGEISKAYLALARGCIGAGSFELYFRSRYRRSRKISVSLTGVPAELGRCRWRVAKRHADRTLLEVELVGPGRRHQIRAGLAHLGHPLLGDSLYGGPTWSGGFGLHALRVSIDGESVTAAPPEAWSG